jgi:hypothetical protein
MPKRPHEAVPVNLRGGIHQAVSAGDVELRSVSRLQLAEIARSVRIQLIDVPGRKAPHPASVRLSAGEDS